MVEKQIQELVEFNKKMSTGKIQFKGSLTLTLQGCEASVQEQAKRFICRQTPAALVEN